MFLRDRDRRLRFAVCFSEIEIGERFLGTQAYRVQESGFRSRKIAERDVGKAEQQQRVVVFGMKLQFAFEFHAGLRIGLFAAEFENRIAKQGVSARIFGIELNGFAKFGDSGFGKMPDGVRASEQYVQCSGVSHGLLQALEQLLAIGETLGLQIGNAKNIGGFEIVFLCDRSLQIADGGGKVSAVELDAAEHVLRARITPVGGGDRLR